MVRLLSALLLLGFLAWAQEERTIWDVWVQDGLAYLATGEGVRVLDEGLREAGFVGGFPAYALAGDGKRLFAASDYGLFILSLGDTPQVQARLKNFPARALAVEGSQVYLGGSAGLWVVDVAGEEPKVLARLSGFAVWAIVPLQNRVLLATDRGLVVVELSSPQAPKVVAEVPLGPAYALAYWQGVLYLSTAQGLVVLGEENGAWKEVGRIAGFRAYRLVVREGLLISVGLGGLRIYGLEDPRQPTLKVSRQALAYTSLFLLGDTLWVTSPLGVYTYGLQIPQLPLLASTEKPQGPATVVNPRFSQRYGAYASVVSGKLAYLATRDGLKVMDLSDPKNPRLIGQVKGFVAYSVHLVGDLLYVGCADGLRVFRVKGPGSLEQRVYLKEKPIYALWFARDVLYLGTEEGLVAVVWQGANLAVRWRAKGGAIYALEARQGYLYGAGAGGLFVLELGRGPEALRILWEEPVFTLVFQQDYLYLGGASGVWVYRLEAPSRLVYVNTLPGFAVWHLLLSGGYLYALTESGLYVLDLTDPGSPVVVSQQAGILWAYLFLFGGYAYGLGPEGVYLVQVGEGATLVLLGLILNYLAQVVAPPSPPTPPPPPPAPAKGWYGTHWVKTWGAQSFFFFTPPTYAVSVVVDGTGFVYVGGRTSGALPGQDHYGGEDAFLAKFDPSGKLLWLRQFGTSSPEGIFGVAVDKAGNVFATGHTLGSLGGANQGDWDFFVAKFTPEGKRVFLKQYGTRLWDKVTGLGIDKQGNLYVGGFTYGAFPGQRSAGDRDYFLAKLDANGNLLWARQGGSRGGEVALGLEVGPDGSIYQVGTTDGILPGQKGHGGGDFFLVKWDTRGNQIFARQYGTERDDRGQSVAVDASGVYVGGTTKGSFRGGGLGTKAFLMKLDGRGSQLWVQEFGVGVVEGEGVITGSAYVVVAPGGNVYLADSASGDLPGFIGAGGADVFVLEYTPKGELKSVLQSGTDDDNLAYALAAGPKGEVYVVGVTGNLAFLMKAKTPLPAYVPR
ncbi:MAG: hypothetical protein ABWJ63_11200 [Thermus sp.]|uniref:hypothetical protein n=1 Tax=Thermus sp. TaxID=275 RepID=UPI00351AF38F